MDQASLTPLRLSLLAAVGAAGCATPAPTGPGTPVEVTLPATPGATPVPVESEPARPRPAGNGFVRESDGTVHRASAVSCDPTIERHACEGNERHRGCATDADCTAQPHGKCVHGAGQIGTYCGCTYSCATDADCGRDEVCVCAGSVPLERHQSVCAPAKCRVDADCGDDVCGVSVFHNGCAERVGLACRTSKDTCRSDADCSRGKETSSSRTPRCAADEDGWACRVATCTVGRPLLVDGAPRTAQPQARRDWQDAVIVDDANAIVDHERALDDGDRSLDRGRADEAVVSALAAHWTEIAALEHASVGSFARFCLELLALGAPPALLADAHRAALDEVEHARIAYGLASRFARRPIGPGALHAAAAPLQADPCAVVRGLIEEGCIGETLGVAEALELAATVRSPVLARIHRRIAEDEQRHAELAWRTLRWMLDTFGEPVRNEARLAFAKSTAAFAADPAARGPEVPEVGLLGAGALGRIRRSALRDVVAPCAAALDLGWSTGDERGRDDRGGAEHAD